MKFALLAYDDYDLLDQLKEELNTNPNDVLVILGRHKMTFFQSETETTHYTRLWIGYYLTLAQDKYDNHVDKEIQQLIREYYSHTRKPRDLVYTDIEYIKDKIALHKIKDAYCKKTGKIYPRSYLNLQELKEEVPDFDAQWIHEYWDAKFYINSIKALYSLRTTYPKSFSKEKYFQYTLETRLFNKVLYNQVDPDTEGTITLQRPQYIEPELIVKFFKDRLLPHIGDFNMSTWMGLQLAIKELDLRQVQELFPLRSEEKKNLSKKQMENLKLIRKKVNKNSSFLPNPQFVELMEQWEDEKNTPSSLSDSDKHFIQGLLYITMWEKVTYRHFSNQVVEYYKNQKERIDSDFLPKPRHMYYTNEYFDPIKFFNLHGKNKKSREELNDLYYRQGLTEASNYQDATEIHKAFETHTVRDIDKVLTLATKKIYFDVDDFDFSFLRLEGEISQLNDILVLLFNLSRTEKEAVPYLIGLINSLRERQLEKSPIYDDKKLIKDNHQKIKNLDKGFYIPYFGAVLAPFQDNIMLIQRSPQNHQYVYSRKTVKFTYEGDRIFEGGKVNWFKSNKLALDQIYMYKIRNQETHFSMDENVKYLMKPEHINTLLTLLIDAHEKYTDIFTDGKEKDHSTEDLKRQNLAPWYITQHLLIMIQILCVSLSLSDPENQLLRQSFDLDKKNMPNFLQLREVLLDNTSFKNHSINGNQIDDLVQHYISTYYTSKSYNALSKKESEALIRSYVDNWGEYLEQTLCFLFSSNIQDYSERVQIDHFLKEYHGECSYYILYLTQYFFNGFNN